MAEHPGYNIFSEIIQGQHYIIEPPASGYVMIFRTLNSILHDLKSELTTSLAGLPEKKANSFGIMDVLHGLAKNETGKLFVRLMRRT